MYMNNEKINMDYMSNAMHIDRSHCFRIRKRIVCKIIDMLYPKIKEFELPIFHGKLKNETILRLFGDYRETFYWQNHEIIILWK